MRMSISETETAYHITVPLPGITNVRARIEDERLRVEGLRRAASADVLKISVDGIAGPRTIRALQSFLKQMNLSPGPMDGFAGPLTVRALQNFLKDREYNVGPVDGGFGRRTSKALQEWIRDLDVCDDRFSVKTCDGMFGFQSAAALQATLNALRVPADHDAKVGCQLKLPADADLGSDDITTTHEHGLLSISVPKRARLPLRELKINAAEGHPAKSSSKDATDGKSSSSKREEVKATDTTDAATAKSNAAAGIEVPEDGMRAASRAEDKEEADAEWVKLEQEAIPEEEEEAAPEAARAPSPTPEEVLRSQLAEIGIDSETVSLLLARHQDKDAVAQHEACLGEALLLMQWKTKLEDLQEMGFADSTANQEALLDNEGRVNSAVRTLVTSTKRDA